jgi:hypothetical protein
MPVQYILVLPWLLQSAQYKNFFIIANFFTVLVPIAQQAGQVVVLGRMSLYF